LFIGKHHVLFASGVVRIGSIRCAELGHSSLRQNDRRPERGNRFGRAAWSRRWRETGTIGRWVVCDEVPVESHGGAVPDDKCLRELAVEVAAVLQARGWTLATAESCTGGWVSKLLTDLPGSSNWFHCGLVTYANSAKQTLLGVSRELLARHGAVSAEAARAMADGALRASGCDVALAVTGVAGPGGGSIAKPVGLVHFAWALPSGTRSACRWYPGERDAVRRGALAQALRGLLEHCRSTDRPGPG
jgi:nicotinamide-nucleotide amidase